MKVPSRLGTVLVLSGFAVATGVSLISYPSAVLAKADGTSEACARIATLASTSSATISAHIGTMDANFASRLAAIASREASVDQKVTTARNAIADKFDAKIKDLKAKSGLTPDQQAAIDTYASDMKDAEQTREDAVDSARATYREGLATEVARHQDDLSVEAGNLQAAIASAFTTAEANCGNGTAVTTLKAAIKTAKQTFSGQRDASKVKSAIQLLAKTRDEAIKTANTTFSTTASTLTTTLENVLKTK